MMLRVILFSAIFFTSCSNTNLLSYRIRPYYKETDSYQSGTDIFLKQAILYDRPNSNDEEYGFGAIFFVDSATLRKVRTIDLNDTAVVQYYHSIPARLYNYYGASFPYRLDGQLTLLKWTNDKIKLKERITVIDSLGQKVHTYYGRRTFKLDDTSTVRRMWF